jgi:hypothetical protein
MGARNYGDFDPIPLTPEILKKAGFEKDEQHDCYVIFSEVDNPVCIEYFDSKLHFIGRDSAYTLENTIYLHQLQNLVFDLTGEELQIEL